VNFDGRGSICQYSLISETNNNYFSTVGTVAKLQNLIKKIVETVAKCIPLIHIYTQTGTSVTSGGVKLVLWL
jgi:hypothetical protein